MTSADKTIKSLAARTQKRLVFVNFLKACRQTGLPVFTIASIGTLLLRLLGWRAPGFLPALLVIGVWILGCAVCAWFQKPSPVQAIALGDEKAERKEMFLSAYCFESLPSIDAGQQLHLQRARDQVSDQRSHLRDFFPLPFPGKSIIAAAFFLVFTASGLSIRTLPPEAASMSERDRLRAKRVGQDLSNDMKGISNANALKPEEKRELKNLKASLADASEKLKNLSKETPRELLEELEKKAREAEKLAKSLGSGSTNKLSSEMIAELERHADTTDFGSALRAEDLKQIAEESEKLGEKLDRKDLTLEEQRRIENALRKSLDKANEQDRSSTIGQTITRAQRNLQNSDSRAAAKQFRNLARRFRRKHQRNQTQKNVQGLARRLRNAGHRIFGQTPKGMRRLPPSNRSPRGLQGFGPPIALRRSQPSTGPEGNNKEGFALPPGNGNKPPEGSPMFPLPGGQNGDGKGLLPGQGNEGGLGSSTPVPGASSSRNANAGKGGLEAGHGTAPYGNKKTRPFDPNKTGVVSPASEGEGPSSLRRMSGMPHGEEASREAHALNVTEFLQTQETALNEKSLPLSRHDQVLRYFTALRRQLENGE